MERNDFLDDFLDINKYIKFNQRNIKLEDVFDVGDYLVPPEGFSILSLSGLLVIFGVIFALLQIVFIVAVIIKFKNEMIKLSKGNGDYKVIKLTLIVLLLGAGCFVFYFSYLALMFNGIT